MEERFYSACNKRVGAFTYKDLKEWVKHKQESEERERKDHEYISYTDN